MERRKDKDVYGAPPTPVRIYQAQVPSVPAPKIMGSCYSFYLKNFLAFSAILFATLAAMGFIIALVLSPGFLPSLTIFSLFLIGASVTYLSNKFIPTIIKLENFFESRFVNNIHENLVTLLLQYTFFNTPDRGSNTNVIIPMY